MTPEDRAPTPLAEPLDVIIDTDIGTDVDDAYALLFALSSPELNVRGITLVHADLDIRARLTFKLLRLMRRTDVKVAKGRQYPLDPGRPLYWGGHEGRGMGFSDVSDMRILPETAPEFIAMTAAEDPGRLVLITIGPMTNAAVAIREFPRAMSRLKGIVAMASIFKGFGPENAGIEHNIALDPEAAAVVLDSGIPTTVIGLNATLKTSFTRLHLDEIEAAGTDLSRLFAHMTNEWLGITKKDRAIMHDPLAVAAAFDPQVVDVVPARASVNLETAGSVAYHQAGAESPLRVCTSVEIRRFDALFHPRILSAVRR